jgi:hypothetical protein
MSDQFVSDLTVALLWLVGFALVAPILLVLALVYGLVRLLLWLGWVVLLLCGYDVQARQLARAERQIVAIEASAIKAMHAVVAKERSHEHRG